MTIQLITGTPGAGKTTYAVAEVIVKEIGRKIPLDNETCINLGLDLGTIVERRIVNAGGFGELQQVLGDHRALQMWIPSAFPSSGEGPGGEEYAPPVSPPRRKPGLRCR